MNRAISLGVERTLFSVESAGLYFWHMRTSFLVECLLRVLNRRVAVAKDASPWQKPALNKLDASSMETTRIREPQGPLVASSLRSERYSPGPLRLSNARSFLDSTSNLYIVPKVERSVCFYILLLLHHYFFYDCISTVSFMNYKYILLEVYF